MQIPTSLLVEQRLAEKVLPEIGQVPRVVVAGQSNSSQQLLSRMHEPSKRIDPCPPLDAPEVFDDPPLDVPALFDGPPLVPPAPESSPSPPQAWMYSVAPSSSPNTAPNFMSVRIDTLSPRIIGCSK